MHVMCSESLGALASKERGLVNCLYSVVAPSSRVYPVPIL